MSNPRSNQEWLQDLNAGGSRQETAIADLRDLLLHAALYFFSRNLDDLKGFDRDEILQLAEDCAQDALIAVMDHLPDFRGDSNFTTWAYKFAINKAMMAARRERWKGVSLDELSSSDEGHFLEWKIQDKSEGITPEQSAMLVEIQSIILDVLQRDLTERQRRVLILMVFNEVPMDEVARLLDTNRNAIYKLLHDARRKLKNRLQARGFETGEIFALFAIQK